MNTLKSKFKRVNYETIEDTVPLSFLVFKLTVEEGVGLMPVIGLQSSKKEKRYTTSLQLEKVYTCSPPCYYAARTSRPRSRLQHFPLLRIGHHVSENDALHVHNSIVHTHNQDMCVKFQMRMRFLEAECKLNVIFVYIIISCHFSKSTTIKKNPKTRANKHFN